MEPPPSRRTILNLLGIAGEAWALVLWIWGSGMEVLNYLGPAEYAAAIVFFGGLLVYANYYWIRGRIDSHNPALNFVSLHDEIEAAALKNQALNFEFGKEPVRRAELMALRYKLSELGIGLPSEREELHRLLPHLLALSKLGRVREARKITAKWV